MKSGIGRFRGLDRTSLREVNAAASLKEQNLAVFVLAEKLK